MNKWFVVNIFYEGLNLNHPEIPSLWEENLLIIKARNKTEAKSKAKKIAKSEQTDYIALDGNKKKWIFRAIGEITELDSEKLYNGLEIFSRFLRDSEAKSLLTPFEE